jgi:putative aminopeptidase
MTDLGAFKELLFELTSLPSVSGMEQAVVQAMYRKLKPLADEVMVDPFGNVIATRYGKAEGPKMMIAAHSDEVGGLVTSITAKGFVRFQLVGEVNPAILPGMRVRVANKIPGTVGSTPGHLTNSDDARRVKQAKELFIDVGGCSAAEVRSWGICEGSSVVFDSSLIELQNPRLVMGKAIDNRVGCATLIKVFENLREKQLPGTLYGVVNVQEEIGMRGAGMTAAQLNPDYAIALDTIPTDDTPSSTSQENLFCIGGGPVVQLWEGKRDLFLGTVAHPAVNKLIRDTAAQLSMPVQISAAYGFWVTDGAAIHTTGQGIPTGFVSIPRRYAHSPNEILDMADALSVVKLLTEIAGETSANFCSQFVALDD